MKKTILTGISTLLISLALVGCSSSSNSSNSKSEDSSSKDAKSEKIASSKKAASESKAKESSKKKAESESKASSIAESQSVANSQAETSSIDQANSQAEEQKQEQANAHQTDDGSNEQRSVIDNNQDGVPDGMDPDEYAQDEGYDSYDDMPQYEKGMSGGNAEKFQDAVDHGWIDENGNPGENYDDYQ